MLKKMRSVVPKHSTCWRMSMLAVGAGILTTGACRDTVEPRGLQPATVMRTVVARSTLGDTASWDTYGADITTRVTHFRADGKLDAFAALPLSYHLERHLAFGHWRTSMTLAPVAAKLAQRAAAQAAVTRVARIEDDGDGTPPRLYNAQGAVIKLPERMPTAPFGGSAPTLPSLPNKTSRPADKPADRSAIKSLVLAPEGATERRAAIVRAFGQVARRTSSSEEYIVQRADGQVTVRVDPAIAAVIEMIEQNGADTILHVLINYDRQADSLALIKSIRISRGAVGSRRASMTETVYQNFYLAKRN